MFSMQVITASQSSTLRWDPISTLPLIHSLLPLPCSYLLLSGLQLGFPAL